MALHALNSSPAVAPRKISRRYDDLVPKQSSKSKRSKRFHQDELSEEIYLALCLVMLSRGDGDCSSSSGAATGEDDNIIAGSIIPAAASIKADVQSLHTAPPTAVAAFNSYKCNVCDKTFSSYQALGGHKTSHRPKPPTGTAAVSSDKNNQGSTPANYVSALNPSGRLHECSICHLTFTSGHALGGHKRKHYEGGSPVKSRTTSSSTAAAASNQMTAAAASDQMTAAASSDQMTAAAASDQMTAISFPRNFDQCDEVESALPPLE